PPLLHRPRLHRAAGGVRHRRIRVGPAGAGGVFAHEGGQTPMSPRSFAVSPDGAAGSARLERLRAQLAEHGVEAFVTAYGANRRYVRVFAGSAGMAVVLPAAAVLLVDGRYTEQARQQAPGWDVRQVDSFYEALAQLLEEAGVRRCGFEEQRVSY